MNLGLVRLLLRAWFLAKTKFCQKPPYPLFYGNSFNENDFFIKVLQRVLVKSQASCSDPNI
jgi:hypothetical protein